MFLISRTLRHIKHYVCKINAVWCEGMEEATQKKLCEAGGKIIN